MDDRFFYDNLERYLDGELDAEAVKKMERLIADNPVYRMEIDRERKFNELLDKYLDQKEAPYELREKVVASLDSKKSWLSQFGWLRPALRPAVIGTLTLVVCLGLWARTSTAFPVFTLSIDRHNECLKGIYSMEIKTDDPKEIARWFQGKLDFAVNPPDLSAQGVKLIGARLCHLGAKKVAFITYEHTGRTISAFILDVRNVDFPRAKEIDMPSHRVLAKSDMGFQSILCLKKQVDGVGCVFVSDIPQDELLKLVM